MRFATGGKTFLMWVLIFAIVMESCALLVFFLFLMMVDIPPIKGGLWPRLLKPWPKGR